jgi:hypothetical protein
VKLTATQKRQVRRIVDISTELGITIRGLLDRRHEIFAEAQDLQRGIDHQQRRLDGTPGGGNPQRRDIPGERTGDDLLQEQRAVVAELKQQVAALDARIDELKVNHGAAQRLAERVLRVSSTHMPGFGDTGSVVAGGELIVRPEGSEGQRASSMARQTQQATATSADGWPVHPNAHAVQPEARASDWITKGTVEE